MKRVIFPKKLKVGKIKYNLVKQYTVIDERLGISEGPFYESEPSDPQAYFMPNAEYTEGLSDKPSIMYRIQKP